ncbi:MAG: DUF885 family protein [Woeseiaceae bacterium]|nr:DUF885 family protein [Woeseiaceae bacterium]
MTRYLSALTLCFAIFLGACGEPQDAPPAQDDHAASLSADSDPLGPLNRPGNYDELIDLHAELVDWRPFSPVDGVVDYSAARIAERIGDIEDMQARLARIGVEGWSVPQQMDYLIVRAELDQEEFILRVTRPWARDPGFYLSSLLRIAFTDLPIEGEALDSMRQNLGAVPAMLEQARTNLTDAAADDVALAIRSLTQSDGVEHGFPYRETPPAGVIGWYEDFLGRADTQPELASEIEAVLTSLRSFHEWLVANQDSMNELNGVGKPALDWFVRNALLIPYTSEEMLVLAQREFERLWAFYALERHRNRGLPEIALPTSREDYEQRLARTDASVRRWLVADEVITIPDYIPKDWREMGFNVPWRERSTGPNFWEAVQFRDPVPDHLHAVIPGHRFDGWVSPRVGNPIRAKANFGARREGWAVYLEEGMMRAGLLDAEPRAQELIYIFGIWRASRTVGDILNQWNEMTLQETADYWVDVTPMLDPDVARKYAYLRPAPGHGLQYTIGALQIFELLSARKLQLREDFVLKDFHDELMSKGKIPVALSRYEMTGDDSVVREFWNRQPLTEFLREQQQ